ncbi:hypothetical protein VNO78_22840 [Psophocarpus tetragonolobus]|uniref:Uncharacterized protein n=1 Tax=Psophocarpus tetragonolobus TaxID=3891 RepID=A0AAN9S2A1_PSOTE
MANCIAQFCCIIYLCGVTHSTYIHVLGDFYLCCMCSLLHYVSDLNTAHINSIIILFYLTYSVTCRNIDNGCSSVDDRVHCAQRLSKRSTCYQNELCWKAFHFNVST